MRDAATMSVDCAGSGGLSDAFHANSIGASTTDDAPTLYRVRRFVF